MSDRKFIQITQHDDVTVIHPSSTINERDKILVFADELTQFIDELMNITKEYSETDERRYMKFDPDRFTVFDDLFDVLFNMMSAACIDNQENIDMLTQNIGLISKAINHQSCMELVVNLLKRNIIDMNKYEIHNSILNYTRIYYSNEVYKHLISSLIKEYLLRVTTTSKIYG